MIADTSPVCYGCVKYRCSLEEGQARTREKVSGWELEFVDRHRLQQVPDRQDTDNGAAL